MVSEKCLLPAVCFTCGDDAYKIIYLDKGCAAVRGAKGYFGICPQHDYSIQPLGEYRVVRTISENDRR